MSPPRIGITMGDPAGVGPELCLRLLADPLAGSRWAPVVFGDAQVLRDVARQCSTLPPLAAEVLPAELWRQTPLESLPTACVVDLRAMDAPAKAGSVGAATGAASYRYLVEAIDAAMAGRVDAVTTGPIQKEALWDAGLRFPGHTEIFAQRTAAPRYCMMLTSDEITCSFVTTHVGYGDVPGLLTSERIVEVIDLTVAAMSAIRGRPPRLAVCGLNPHAGEHGLFGNREEERIIAPAVELARGSGVQIEGPLPPDTAFLPRRRAVTDAFVCMYHDQGHIPLKALAFEDAVNVTLGLPIIRTSVDHGTALDIAWRGVADDSSFRQAVQLAARLAAQPRPASA